MASNQIKISLMFSADTSKAQSSLKNLQTSLNDLTKSVKVGDFKITDQVKEAYEATEKLKQALNASVNMSTGQFDLTKFQGQLKAAGLSAQDLSKKMAQVGPAGVKAFNDLAIAVANAEIPTKRVNEWLDKMAKSLKDTMRWQISSSVIHGFTGALQQAYGYAQNLNKSLNDIRIVTSYSSEDMANFADQANRAAKALSTSTNEYAKASLIYYQQGGMSDEEIAKRTAATIKMANVTGESARDISSYMTAIWNNFEDGSKSLEYYADVIAKLGAETASSSEEIATGMQKFASIANTVGLSYEYAASALATVVAATRQSEDTVGTSFKTIFSRLSSLSLGETLEDNTTLTKYSAALAKAGVNIKDNNDKLKSMDTILDELGARWDKISTEQKNALAYTVAGSRQYTNFIALMDNYKNFKVNVDLAIDAEGTLEEQQKIYEESWQAAANRVRSAAEGIFQDLIDDDFFITLLDGFEKLLSMLDQFIDAIGGLPGVLSLVSSLLLRIFSTQAKQGLENLGYNLKSFLGINQQQSTKTKEEFLKASKKSAEDMMSRVDVKEDPALQAELDSLAKRSELEREYIRLEETLTEQQKEKYRAEMQILDILQKQKKVRHQEMSEAEDETRGTVGAVIREATEAAQKKSWEGQQLDTREQLQASISGYEKEQAQRDIIIKDYESKRATKKDIIRIGQGQLDQIDRDIIAQTEFNTQARSAGTLTAGDVLKLEKLQSERATVRKSMQDAKAVIDEMDQAVLAAAKEQEQTAQMLKEAKEALAAMNDATWDSSAFDVSQSAFIGEAFQGYIDKETTAVTREVELQSLLKASTNIPNAQANPEAHRQALEQLQTSLTEFNQKYSEELGEETQRVIEAIIADVQSDFSTEEGGTSITADSIQKYSEQVKNAARIDANAELGDIRESLSTQGINFSEEQFTTIQTTLDDYIKKVRQAAEITQSETEAMSKSLENLEKKDKEPIPYKFSDSFINLSQGIMSATTALASFQGIWSTLTNPDLSGWEKFTTVLMSIGTVIGSVISAISALQQVQFKQMGITIKNTAADIANALAKKINTKFTKENTQAKRANAQATEDSTKETNQETGAKIVNGATEKFTGGGAGKVKLGTKIKGGFQNFGKGFMATAKGMAGKSGATVAAAGSGSVGSALGSIAAVAAPIAVAAAAVAITVAAIVNAYQAAEKAAKQAKKQAESLRAAAAEVKQEYQETIDTISNYQNALDGIEKLTKGTQEWRDAVADVNNQARELIEKFGTELSAGDYYFEDGQIKFKEGVLEELQQKEYEAMMQAQAGADSASAIALQRRNEADKIEFARKNMRTGQAGEETWSIAGVAGGGAVAGAAIGTFIPIPVIGNLIGAGIGAIVGAIGGAIATGIAGASSKAEEEALDKLTELYRKDNTIIDQMAYAQKSGQLSKFADEYGISEELANSLLKNRDATEELIIQMAANANEMQLLRESIAANANAGKTAYDKAENQEYINARVANLMKDSNSKEYQAAQAKIDELFKGSNEDFWDLYLSEVIGDNENYRVTNQGGAGVTLQKKDENGNWVTDETLGKNGLMEVDAIEALRNVLIADLASDTIESLDVEAQKLTKSLSKAGIANKEVAKKAVKAQESGEAIDLSLLTKAQLDNLNISAITNKELAAAVEQAQKNAQTSWTNMLADFSYSTQKAINELDSATFETTEQFTREQLKIYGTALDQLARIGGDSVAQAFNDNLTQLLNTNKDAAYEIMSIISEIDWSNPEEGLWAFQNGLSEIGVYIDVMSWNIDELGKKFKDIDFSHILTNLDTIASKIKDIWEFDDLKIGDTITQDRYDKASQEYQAKFLRGAPIDEDEEGNLIYEYIYKGPETDTGKDVLFQKYSKDLQDFQNQQNIVGHIRGSEWYQSYLNIQNGEASNVDYANLAFSLLQEDQGEQFLREMRVPQNAIEKWRGNITDKIGQKNTLWDEISSSIYFRNENILEEYKDYLLPDGTVDPRAMQEAEQAYNVALDMSNFNPDDPTVKEAEKILLDLQEIQLAGSKKDYLEKYKLWQDLELKPDAIYNMPEAISTAITDYMSKYNTSNIDMQTNFLATASSVTQITNAIAAGLITDENLAQQYINTLKGQVNALKSELNIYEDEEAQINSINRSLGEQQEITEKLHGKTKLQSLEKELNLNKQLLLINKQGLEVAKQELREKTTEFEQEAEDKGWGEEFINKIEYDEFKNVVNWEELENYLYTTIGETAVDEFKTLKNEIAEAEGKIKEFTDGIKESEEVINSYWASQAEAIAENYDFIFNKQKELRAQVENYHNIVGLIGKNTLGIDNETLQEMNKSLTQITVAELQTSYDHYIQQQKNREKAEQDYLNNRNATTEDALEKAKNAEAQALAEMNSQWSVSLEQASQTLQDNIGLIMDSFEQSIAGIYGSFERMIEFYDQRSQLSDQYLTDYKKIYELNKLSRDIQNSIDNNDNVKSKQILNDLQSDLNELQENSVQMSQYDLDYLQRKYELRLAEIALEESQNAKNQVRLQKTADGSWGYVYTQDEELINKAQQEYEDKLFNLQDLNHSYLDTVSQQILSTQSEFESAIMEIYSAGLSPEEQKKRIDETVQYYQNRLAFLTSEFDQVIENNKGLQNMVQSFSDTLLGSLYPENYDSAEDIFDMFTEKLNGDEGLLAQLQGAADQYSSTITSIFDTLNTSMTDFTSNMQSEINKLVDSIKELSLQMMSQYDLGLGFDRNQSINILETKAHYSADWDKYGNDFIKQMWNLAVSSGQLDASYGLFSSFDTGGYTGEWGPQGRIAMLHQKEIVLNAQDTENLLAAVDLIRRVSQTIDLEAAAAKTTSLLNNFFNLPDNNKTIQQEVTIHAEFPNATNHSEIEQAFDTLINRASQYANRK